MEFLRFVHESCTRYIDLKPSQLPWTAILIAVATIVVVAYQERKVRGSTRWWIISVHALAMLLTPAYALCRLGLSVLFMPLLLLSGDFEAVNLVYIDESGKELGPEKCVSSRRLTIAAYCLSGGCLDIVVRSMAGSCKIIITSPRSVGTKCARILLHIIGMVLAFSTARQIPRQWSILDATSLLDFHIMWLSLACGTVLGQCLLAEIMGFSNGRRTTHFPEHLRLTTYAVTGSLAVISAAAGPFVHCEGRQQDGLFPLCPWRFAYCAKDATTLRLLAARSWPFQLEHISHWFSDMPGWKASLAVAMLLTIVLCYRRAIATMLRIEPDRIFWAALAWPVGGMFWDMVFVLITGSALYLRLLLTDYQRAVDGR